MPTQQAFNEKWSKLVAPRLQEDAKLAQAERQGLRHKRAEAQRSSEQQHMSGQCVRLLQEFEELQAAVADLREAAASACLPLGEAERDALGTALAALPLHQLEGAVAIALARSPGLRDVAHEVGKQHCRVGTQLAGWLMRVRWWLPAPAELLLLSLLLSLAQPGC